MYVSGTVMQAKSLQSDNQEKTDITPSPYEIPSTMQRVGKATIKKEDLSSEPSEKIHNNQAASPYEVPVTMQRNQSATTLEKKSLSPSGMPNIDPMELDLPVSDFMKSSDVIFYLFSLYFIQPLVFETSFIGDDGVINQVYMENAVRFFNKSS